MTKENIQLCFPVFALCAGLCDTGYLLLVWSKALHRGWYVLFTELSSNSKTVVYPVLLIWFEGISLKRKERQKTFASPKWLV